MELVCELCGVRVVRVQEKAWKHAAGPGSNACGLPPVPVERGAWWGSGVVVDVRRRLV